MRLGLEDMVASDVEEYIRLAVRAASDLDRLEALRHGLRQRFRASTLFDGALLAGEVEEAYRWMWRQRVATKGI
jgi:predicted O-linked N-acetylglucosamine transferase (SPINDLY family)